MFRGTKSVRNSVVMPLTDRTKCYEIFLIMSSEFLSKMNTLGKLPSPVSHITFEVLFFFRIIRSWNSSWCWIIVLSKIFRHLSSKHFDWRHFQQMRSIKLRQPESGTKLLDFCTVDSTASSSPQIVWSATCFNEILKNYNYWFLF